MSDGQVSHDAESVTSDEPPRSESSGAPPTKAADQPAVRHTESITAELIERPVATGEKSPSRNA